MEQKDNMTKKSLNLVPALNYRLPNSSKGTISRRDSLSRNASGTSQSITPGSMISFTIPPASNRVLACRETYFRFGVKLAGATDIIGGPVQNLISKVRILTDSGSVLEDLQSYNVLNRVVEWAHYSDTYLNDVLQPEGLYQVYSANSDVNVVNSGAGLQLKSSADGNTFGTGQAQNVVARSATNYSGNSNHTGANGINYFFTLHGSGILNNDRFYPLMASGLTIEITLESTAIALSVSTGDYLIQNPKIYYTSLTLSDQVAATLSQAMRESNMYLPYETFIQKSITTPDNATSATLEISQPFFRVKDLLMVQRFASTQFANFDSFVFHSSNFASFQTQYADQYSPVDAIVDLKRLYLEFKKALNQFGSIASESTPYQSYINGRCIFACNYESLLEDPMSGSSTKNGRGIIANWGYTAATPSTKIDSFMHISRVLKINSDSGISILE